MVEATGLEPARMLLRGILRLGGAKIAVFWVTQQSAKTGQKRTKTPKNASKSTIRSTVQHPLKITKKCELPKSTRRKLTKRPFFLHIYAKK